MILNFDTLNVLTYQPTVSLYSFTISTFNTSHVLPHQTLQLIYDLSTHLQSLHYHPRTPNPVCKMPKGQKLIDWTPENDARLILTIIAVANIHPNCEAVAAAFGELYPSTRSLLFPRH